MKVSVAQINTTPCDFRGNVDRIKVGIKKAGEDKSSLVVFPELTICGYGIKDMIYHKDFVLKNLGYLKEVINYSVEYPSMYICVGYVDANTSGAGKPFKNMAAVIKNGLVVTTYQKQLLP